MSNSKTYFHNFESINQAKKSILFIAGAGMDHRLVRAIQLSESQVASEIFVNVNYIKGIEHGDYSIFPARVFALQYFKKYANFLDLKLDFFDIYNSEQDL